VFSMFFGWNWAKSPGPVSINQKSSNDQATACRLDFSGYGTDGNPLQISPAKADVPRWCRWPQGRSMWNCGFYGQSSTKGCDDVGKSRPWTHLSKSPSSFAHLAWC
jgi:hypothetical protein